jgi:beta-lactam-binding protein with PASTA domain
MGLRNLLSKKEFWKIIMYGIFLYIILFLLVLLGLRIYTHHGKSFPVPDFKGLKSERVQDIAASRDLIIEIIDSTYIPYLQKGSVIDQYPRPGINVKKNRTIFLTLNAFNQAKVEMPNVVGVSYRQAKTTLESRGLKVGKLVYERDFAKNNVLRMMHKGKGIESGTMIEKGENIDLALGNGLARSTTPVPDLIKLTYNKAINEINDAYLNIGVVNFDTTVHNYIDTINALVWKQRPGYSPESRSVMGGKVTIWLTLNPEMFPKPDTSNIDLN